MGEQATSFTRSQVRSAMYARMVSMHFEPDQMPAASRVAREMIEEMEALAPSLQQLSGFQGKYALLDPIRGKVAVITFFETREDERAYFGSEPQRRMSRMIPRFSAISGTSPTITTFEVAAQVLPAPLLVPV